jgi:hypothetical protein
VLKIKIIQWKLCCKLKVVLNITCCVQKVVLQTKSYDENKNFIFGGDGTPYERACSGNEIDSDLSEQLVTRLFQTRPQNSIWRLTRSGSYTLLLFLLYSSKYFCCYNQEMFAILLSSCSRYNANFKLDQSVSAIHDSPPYFWDQWGWPPTHSDTRPRYLMNFRLP